MNNIELYKSNMELQSQNADSFIIHCIQKVKENPACREKEELDSSSEDDYSHLLTYCIEGDMESNALTSDAKTYDNNTQEPPSLCSDMMSNTDLSDKSNLLSIQSDTITLSSASSDITINGDKAPNPFYN
jgi:hypothetical protein